MKIKQLRQKIPLLILFLALTIGLLLYGLFANDDAFDNDFTRSKAIFLGVVCTFTSLLWFFFGEIDWTHWNAAKKKMGYKVDESESESD